MQAPAHRYRRRHCFFHMQFSLLTRTFQCLFCASVNIIVSKVGTLLLMWSCIQFSFILLLLFVPHSTLVAHMYCSLSLVLCCVFMCWWCAFLLLFNFKSITTTNRLQYGEYKSCNIGAREMKEFSAKRMMSQQIYLPSPALFGCFCECDREKITVCDLLAIFPFQPLFVVCSTGEKCKEK